MADRPTLDPQRPSHHTHGRYGPADDNTTSSHVTLDAYGHHRPKRIVSPHVLAMDKPLGGSRSKSQASGHSSGEGSTAMGKSSHPKHPFENSKHLLVVLPNDAIDVEEEARLYDELCAATQSVSSDLPASPKCLAEHSEYFAPFF